MLDVARWRQAGAIARIARSNPFLPERLELERAALGTRFVEVPRIKWRRPGQTMEQMFPNFFPIAELGTELLEASRQSLREGASANEEQLRTYEDLGLVVLYFRYSRRLGELVRESLDARPPQKIPLWDDFSREYRHYFELPGRTFPSDHDAAHALAGLYQIERAYHSIFQYIAGGSMSAAKLRASIWQSIFTHDMQRYGRVLFDHMQDIPSLIIGPSGSGKELVARAIGLSRYIPFDARQQRFQASFVGSFHAVNLAALATTLIESELFGHRKGAFTGALADREGWLEVCQDLGTVFLDEIAEVEPAIQVKLLRVLQERRFQRLGDTEDRTFQGKLIAATNRDLGRAMQRSEFREDLYYRLCADVVRTPSLHQQITEEPGDLANLVAFAVSRTFSAGDAERDVLSAEVVSWIEEHLGIDYAWPGNFRELEQCVRNIMVRREYHPMQVHPNDAASDLTAAIRAGRLTESELVTAYCKIVFQQSGSYRAAAQRLQIDWRTVKARLNDGEKIPTT